MDKNMINKITSIFLIVSAFCLVAIWVILFCAGQINDYFNPLKFKTLFLMIAEFTTALLMFISGISYLAYKKNYSDLQMFSLGMLFYAVLIGTGEFTDRKIYVLSILFPIVAVFTIVILIINQINKNK